MRKRKKKSVSLSNFIFSYPTTTAPHSFLSIMLYATPISTTLYLFHIYIASTTPIILFHPHSQIYITFPTILSIYFLSMPPHTVFNGEILHFNAHTNFLIFIYIHICLRIHSTYIHKYINTYVYVHITYRLSLPNRQLTINFSHFILFHFIYLYI